MLSRPYISLSVGQVRDTPHTQTVFQHKAFSTYIFDTIWHTSGMGNFDGGWGPQKYLNSSWGATVAHGSAYSHPWLNLLIWGSSKEGQRAALLKQVNQINNERISSVADNRNRHGGIAGRSECRDPRGFYVQIPVEDMLNNISCTNEHALCNQVCQICKLKALYVKSTVCGCL
jgi:hypothetical protein